MRSNEPRNPRAEREKSGEEPQPETFSSTALHADPNPVEVLDQDRRIVYVNPSFERVTGFSAEDLIGKKPPYPYWHPGDCERLKQDLESNSYGGPQQFCTKSGRILTVQVKSAGGRGKGPGKCYIYSWEDVADHKETEPALLQERDWVKKLLQVAGVIILALDPAGKVTLVNARACEIIGSSEQDILGKDWIRSYLPSRIRTKVGGNFRKLISGQLEPVEYMENSILTAGGEERIIAWHNTLVKDENGLIVGTLSSGEDITERRKAEESLQESEENFRTMAEAAPLGIGVVGIPKGNYLYVNSAYGKAFGYAPNEMIGMTTPDIYWDVADRKKILKLLKKDGVISGYEIRLKKKDGTMFWSISSVRPISFGGVPALLGLFMDVTDRKKMEVALEESREQLRKFSLHLQEELESEKKNLAAEIHDEMGQLLTVLRIDINQLAKGLPTGAEQLLEKTRSMTAMVNEIDNLTEKIAADLRPTILDTLGLAAAMRWLVQQFKTRSGISCSLLIQPEEFVLDKQRSLDIFRIGQEALTNVSRHSKANRVRVWLKFERGTVHLRIADNGKGTTPQQINDERSFGLVGMRERARRWGGKLEIETSAGGGTTIKMSLPTG